jgi:hypothetical protein
MMKVVYLIQYIIVYPFSGFVLVCLVIDVYKKNKFHAVIVVMGWIVIYFGAFHEYKKYTPPPGLWELFFEGVTFL